MTKSEFKVLRSEYRRVIKSAWEEYQYYNGDGFAPSNEKADSAYYRYWRLLNFFANAINCSVAQAAKMFNLKEV